MRTRHLMYFLVLYIFLLKAFFLAVFVSHRGHNSTDGLTYRRTQWFILFIDKAETNRLWGAGKAELVAEARLGLVGVALHQVRAGVTRTSANENIGYMKGNSLQCV